MSIFNEVMSFDVDALLSKSMDEMEKDDMELSVSPASPADGHHGGGEMGGVELDQKKDITKVSKGEAMASFEGKEPSMSSSIPQKLQGKQFGMPEMSNEPKSWPGKDFAVMGDAEEAALSADDVMVSQQLGDHPRPLAQEAEEQDGGDVSLGSNRRMLKGFAQSADIRFVPQAGAAEAHAAQAMGTSWQSGVVTYNTSLDERIAKALEDQTLIAEPTLNWQAPLIKSHVCGNSLCKSAYPSFLTVCPNCHTGQQYQGVTMSKSVEASVKGPTQGDVRFVSSNIKLG